MPAAGATVPDRKVSRVCAQQTVWVVACITRKRADQRRLPVTFEEFAASRLPAVLAFAAVLTGQRATAEDIAQEVLIRV